jgi:hypothetical protein
MTVGCENEYCRNQNAQIAIAEEKRKKEEAARDDLNRGEGLVSPSVCKDAAPQNNSYDIGPIANLPCKLRELTNSSGAVNSTFQQALNTQAQKLITAEGWGLLGSIGQLLSGVNNLQLMGNAISGAFGGSNGGGSNNTGTSNSIPTQDLSGNGSAKDSVAQPVLKRLGTYVASLNTLEQINAGFMSEITAAEADAAQVRSCFQSLVNDFSLSLNDYRVASGFSYYQTRMTQMASLRAKIAQDTSSIQAARVAVDDVKMLVAASNSSQEINTAYTTFETKVENGTLPSETASARREGELAVLRGENQTINMEGGSSYSLRNQCQNTRQQLTPVNAY